MFVSNQNKRIIFKILSSGVNLLLTLILGVLVPRIIGPESYGEYSFVIATYSFWIQFLLFSSNTAYIYYISINKYSIESLNFFYFVYLSFISLITIVISVLTFKNEPILNYIWNGLSDFKILILGLVFSLLYNFQQRLLDFSDSTSNTIKSEKIRLSTKFLVVVFVLFFIALSNFNLNKYFFINILSLIIFIVSFQKLINIQIKKTDIDKLYEIFIDFYNYLKPLFLFAVVSSFYSYFGKYVLQAKSGSIEQGYFNFALQITMIPVGFVFSLMALLLSDMSKKENKKNIIGLKKIFNNSVDKLFALHAFFSFFIMINANEIVLLFVGESYLHSVPAIKALSLFSLFNTLGMISSNVFYSTGRNRLFAKINTSIMILGIILYIFYFVNTIDFSALKLSLLMLSVYSLRVIIQLFYNLSYLKINKLFFLTKIIKIATVIIFVVCFTNSLSLSLFYNIILTSVILIFINFLLNDFLNIMFIKSFLGKGK